MRRHLGGGIWSALQGFWFRILGDFSLSIRVQVGWPLACGFFQCGCGSCGWTASTEPPRDDLTAEAAP